MTTTERDTMIDTPIYDQLANEALADGHDIDGIMSRPRWSFEEATARLASSRAGRGKKK